MKKDDERAGRSQSGPCELASAYGNIDAVGGTSATARTR
jgi:hypothetical protein